VSDDLTQLDILDGDLLAWSLPLVFSIVHITSVIERRKEGRLEGIGAAGAPAPRAHGEM
jgi:hypothetical protein